jgi:formiminotetrahydrofolate cyclodeaminase
LIFDGELSIPAEGFPLPAELPSLTQFAQRMAVGNRRASAGATAALAAALACDLVGQVAERSQGWNEHLGALAQVDALRDRATRGARDVAAAYGRLVEALDDALGSATRAEGTELGSQLVIAADLLLEIAETACDCAALAALVTQSGDTVVRADAAAAAAAALAAAATEMAVHLVEVNLLASKQPDRLARAAELVTAAAASRSAARAAMT